MIDGVKVSVNDRTVNVEGPKGKLDIELRPEVDVAMSDDGKEAIVTRKNEDRISKAMHGLTRALLNNMSLDAKRDTRRNSNFRVSVMSATFKAIL